jgi:hypothetical protein
MIVFGAHRQGMHRRRGHPEGGAIAHIPVPDGHRRRGQGREHLVVSEVSTTQITSPAPMVPKSRPPAALA